jgi:aryl-alcohol dehydrogenase-like predicted oxidoreductase
LALAWVLAKSETWSRFLATKRRTYLELNAAVVGIMLTEDETVEIESAVPLDAIACDR